MLWSILCQDQKPTSLSPHYHFIHGGPLLTKPTGVRQPNKKGGENGETQRVFSPHDKKVVLFLKGKVDKAEEKLRELRSSDEHRLPLKRDDW